MYRIVQDKVIEGKVAMDRVVKEWAVMDKEAMVSIVMARVPTGRDVIVMVHA